MPIEYSLHTINSGDFRDCDGDACSYFYQRDFLTPIINDDENASISKAATDTFELKPTDHISF